MLGADSLWSVVPLGQIRWSVTHFWQLHFPHCSRDGSLIQTTLAWCRLGGKGVYAQGKLLQEDWSMWGVADLLSVGCHKMHEEALQAFFRSNESCL